MDKNELVVIALGQELRGDDAVGLHIVRHWQQRHPETAASHRVRVEISPLPGLHLLDLLQGARVAILVDAVHSGQAPGSIVRCKGDAIAGFEQGGNSAHGWGVGETLALAAELDMEDLPPICVMGIEAGDMHMGEGLSEAVGAAVPQAAERLQARVLATLRSLRAESSEAALPLTVA
jgi:hydrogenase maturation protease